jgi:hypothetical protein
LSDENRSDVLTSYSKHSESRRIHSNESKEDGKISTIFKRRAKKGKF